MEIKIEKSILADALAWVQSVVDRKTTMPLLSHVHLEAKNGTLTLTATDLEVGVIGTVKTEVVNGGKVTVPARGFYEIVKELPNQPIELKSNPNHWLEIRCAKSLFKLVGMDANEYPNLPKKGEGLAFDLDAKTLAEMIHKVDFAVSTDEARYNLNGIFIETGEKEGKNTLKMVATDGHRISLSEKEISKKVPLKQGVIFPRKGVSELKRLLEEEGEIHFWVGDKHAIIEKGERVLIVRLIDGQFPPYQHVIPQKQKRVLSVSKDSLSQSLKRVAVVTTDRSRGVKFSVSPGILEISANNPDMGEAKEEISIQYKGSTFAVGFNAAYFLESLSVLEDEQVVLQLNDEVSPCLIQSEFDRGFTHVIMPMRL